MDRGKTTRETINVAVFTPPPGPALPVIPRPEGTTPPTAPARRLFTLFFSEFQNRYLSILGPADITTPTQIELPQNPTPTALPAPGGSHRPKAFRARLICKLNPKRKLHSLNKT